VSGWLDWCIGNVVGRYDARGNVYPRKQRPKIDGAVAPIMGIARHMTSVDEGIYADFRGVLILD
jgi:phage terminase large subunit-like protein